MVSRLNQNPEGKAKPSNNAVSKSEGDAPEATATATEVHCVSSADLIGPSGLLHINHDGYLYTLRITRNRKLLLTK